MNIFNSLMTFWLLITTDVGYYDLFLFVEDCIAKKHQISQNYGRNFLTEGNYY